MNPSLQRERRKKGIEKYNRSSRSFFLAVANANQVIDRSCMIEFTYCTSSPIAHKKESSDEVQ